MIGPCPLGRGPTRIVSANKAPGGYGLGTISQTVTDFDTVKLNGWYFGAIGTAHAPDSVNEWSVRVTNLAHNSEVCIQDAYAITNVNAYLHRRRLVYIDTATQDNPWEWVAPPMTLGQEYRTTEHYMDKPVYTMAFSFGALPNASDKGVVMPGTDGTCKIIEIHGYASNEMSLPGVSGVSEALQVTLTGLGNTAYVKTGADRSSATATIVAKYIKTTD